MSMEAESKELFNEYLKMAASYSIPIFWGVKRGSTWDIKNSGTAFILNTGEKTFVVTAAHVYRSYIKHRAAGIADESQLSNISFEMESRLICLPKNGKVDIATFEITDSEITALGKSVLHGSNSSWPPKSPNEGEAVVVAGFPGGGREHRVEHVFSFGIYCFNTPVSSVSTWHFGCSFDREHWVDIFGKGFPPKNYDMGGVSGAPALALEKSEAGIVSWRLAGVVYEANASELLGEILFCNHAHFIESNGVIKENA